MALETTWWVGVYAICYRFQPTVLLMRSDIGTTAVRRAGAWLQRNWPSRYEGIAKAADRVYGSPNGRAFGEWVLINKVLAPISFPAKLALANRIVNQRAAQVLIAGAAGVALAADEPDLEAAAVEEGLDKVVRSVTDSVSSTVSVVGVKATTTAVSLTSPSAPIGGSDECSKHSAAAR